MVPSPDPAPGEAPPAAGRTVVQVSGRRGHRLQPSWVNTGAHRDRFAQVAPFVTGRTVLDVGCVSGFERPDWLHALLASVAKEIVGIDVDAGAVARARAAGYDLLVADACSFDLGRRFDVVHAGELLEHLDDPRGFLASARRHLGPDGSLVITTPNAFCATNFVYRIGGVPKVNRDHVAWYCEDTLTQLLQRNGFTVREVRYLRHTTPGRTRAVVARTARRLLPRRMAWNTLLAVATPQV